MVKNRNTIASSFPDYFFLFYFYKGGLCQLGFKASSDSLENNAAGKGVSERSESFGKVWVRPPEQLLSRARGEDVLSLCPGFVCVSLPWRGQHVHSVVKSGAAFQYDTYFRAAGKISPADLVSILVAGRF